MTPAYPVFDADNHLYEHTEAMLEYLPQKYKRNIQIYEIKGHKRIVVNGQVTEFIPNPTFEKVARPGCHVDYYRDSNDDGLTLREMTGDPIDSVPAFREPAPRIEVMDDLGINATLMFPTIANLLEYSLDGDPDLTHAAIHAENEWMRDVWSFDYQSRIFATPVLTLPIVEEAVKELEWVLDNGAKAILVRPAPATGLRGSRSIALPEFDPFWARVEEAGVLVCMHGSFPPLWKYYETWEGGRTDSHFKPTALRNMLIQHREIEDALAAMICHGALTRFPNLNLLSVENGAEWVPHLVEALDATYRRMPQEFDEHPVEVFKRNVYISPFWEQNIEGLVDLIGADHILFGSDWPHPEGLDKPLEYLDFLDGMPGLDPTQKQQIMSDNGNALLGIAA